MVRREISLKRRDLYLKRLIAFQDTEPVKIITGIRRCGKSSLMKLMMRHLLESGKEEKQLLFMNFESMDFRGMDAVGLYQYVKERMLPEQKMYLFFDEIQKVPEWQDAVNSFRVDFECDIYVTGSNAYLLSSEFSTYLSGRFVEIRMYPLSFREFVEFQGCRLEETAAPAGIPRKRIYDEEGHGCDVRELFEMYMRYGGMPGIAEAGWEWDHVQALLDGIYSTVIVRDILERERRKGRQVTDAELLRRIVLFLADNIGNNTSLNTISNTLVGERLLENRSKKGRPAIQTISAYVGALTKAYFFYEIKRFDIKGRDYLRTLGKYYIVDIGLRNCLLGYRDIDTGHILENIVYFELLRRGYAVAIGKVGQLEVDFIATKGDEKIYYQVTQEMNTEETQERELQPLRMIPDHYEKVVIALDCYLPVTQDGIRIVRLLDFLLADY